MCNLNPEKTMNSRGRTIIGFIIVMAAVAVFAAMLPAQVFSANAWIRDADGRALLLHGANVSGDAKWAPGFTAWHTYEDYERMKTDWGFNVARFLIFWAGIEPEQGVYDDEYLDVVEERLDWAESIGLYVILDMHQDIYGYKFGGDGAPDWAVWDDGRYFGGGLEPWWLNNLWPAVRRAFANLWTDEELQMYFHGAWAHVAERFADHPAVLGFEIINEPFCGDILPWNFETTVLPWFYKGVIDAMRAVAPDKIVFYEPHITATPGFRSLLPPIGRENLVYFPHCYNPLLEESLFPYTGLGWQVDLYMNRRDSDARRAGVPWMVGEFGVSGSLQGFGRYLNDICDGLDRRLAGWTYWSYDRSSNDGWGLVDEDGNETVHLQYLVRPYAQKTAGDPVKMRYARRFKRFTLTFAPDPAITAPTEIYTGGERIYPSGFDVKCSAEASSWHWEYDETCDILSVWIDEPGETHWIRVVPAP